MWSVKFHQLRNKLLCLIFSLLFPSKVSKQFLLSLQYTHRSRKKYRRFYPCRSYPRLILHCFVTEFGYLQKEGYFPLELFATSHRLSQLLSSYSVKSFIRLTQKIILITLNQRKQHTVLSTFRLHAGSLHRNFFIYLCHLFFRHVVGQALRSVSYSDITFLVR